MARAMSPRTSGGGSKMSVNGPHSEEMRTPHSSVVLQDGWSHIPKIVLDLLKVTSYCVTKSTGKSLAITSCGSTACMWCKSCRARPLGHRPAVHVISSNPTPILCGQRYAGAHCNVLERLPADTLAGTLRPEKKRRTLPSWSRSRSRIDRAAMTGAPAPTSVCVDFSKSCSPSFRAAPPRPQMSL
eukprot:2755561-Rhodomonas_salina.1